MWAYYEAYENKVIRGKYVGGFCNNKQNEKNDEVDMIRTCEDGVCKYVG